MALLLIEGFEQYGADTETPRGGWQVSSLANFNPIAGRLGGQAIEYIATSQSALLPVPSPPASFVMGFAYRAPNGAFANFACMQVRFDTVTHLRLRITVAGELAIDRNTTQLEITSGLGLTQNVWYYIELKATISNTGSYEVKVDGAQVLFDASVDTLQSGTALINNIFLVGHSVMDPNWDDIYFLDTVGSDNTDFLGDCRVETVFPDALGNENDFTASPAVDQHLNVDDGSSPDDDTTYNHSATATDRELYGFAALTGNIGTIFGVDAKMLVRKEDAGFREIRVIARSNVTEVESANLTLGIDYHLKHNIFENDPDGGGDWDEASVNAAQFGIDLQT